ncbi:hypothetical protein [Noviherbaspirillum aerium]|uniref:hypothetical protein n=1 Tax=Noviherbaspirillum aerium TaxID=2588497 RepID=UPI00124F4F79|nr:hypothetical protein [Noviherbaspirillum aerium]
MRRILDLIVLLPTSFLTVFCFIGYANVVDTMSMKMGAFFMYQVFFWIACTGIALLFVCQALRMFAARRILIISLLSCVGFILFSVAAYPANYDDPRAPLALSHSPRELYSMLAVMFLLLVAAVFEPRLRKVTIRLKH